MLDASAWSVGPPVPHDRLAAPLDYPPRRPRRRRAGVLLFLLMIVLLAAASTAVSYYVDALWFASLGYADVFWTSLNIQALVFTGFTAITFLVLYGAFLALKPARFGELGTEGVVIINGRPVLLPVGPVLRFLAIVISLVVALATGAAMMADWPVFALWWYGGHGRVVSAAAAAGPATDPIFGRSIGFYLFTLPAWELVAGWFLFLAVLTWFGWVHRSRHEATWLSSDGKIRPVA